MVRLAWIIGGGLSGWLVAGVSNPGALWLQQVGISVIGMVVGYLAGLRWNSMMEFLFRKKSGFDIVIKSIGLLCGLGVTALLTTVLRPVIDLFPLNGRLLLMFWLVCITVGIIMTITALKSKDLMALLFNSAAPAAPKSNGTKNQFKVLDTSAIIDGRIADLCKTGFLEGVLIIPTFVLSELQKIADSADPLRRNRGRRGLDILNKIQKENLVAVRIFDRDYEDLAEVDTKLLRLSKELEAKVVTNDYNLNKVAELYGVHVLNINDLSNAIKPVVIPGEEMVVHVLRDGKEHGQGIGYLEDGTMIVVEGGKSYIGLDIEILVTSILQTSAGRMIFAKPKEYMVSRVTS